MVVRPQVKKLASLVSIPSTAMEHQTKKNERQSGSYSIGSLWKRRPYAALEWDASLEKVVSMPDQVGLRWQDLSSCSKSAFYCSGLADVISVPHELLELKDLKDILSLEAWNMCLSESEREFLTEFLPKEIDKESSVHRLLSGDNFHFENPLFLWGASVCAGATHPDSLCARDREFKIARRTYYCEMQNYHERMLNNLSVIKEIWISCRNSEKSFCTNLQSWRSKKKASKCVKYESMKIVPHAQTKKFVDEGNNFVDKKMMAVNTCKFSMGSINNILRIRQRKRRKVGSLQASLEKAAVVSIDRTKRHIPITYNSTTVEPSAEVMCTIRVNSWQYGHILKLKHAGEEVRIDSLSSILGSPDKLGIHYLSTLDESDTQRIHEYWSKLVQGIAVASAAFLERKVHKIETAKTFSHQCLHGRSRSLRKTVACEVDDFRDIELSKMIMLGPSQQLETLANTCIASSPPSPSSLTWHNIHTSAGLVCRTNLKAEICIQQQASASDSSTTVSKIADAGASLTHLILNGHSPSKDQDFCQHTPNVSPYSIRNNECFFQADISGKSMISGLESETVLGHGIDEPVGTQRGIANLVIPEIGIIANDDEASTMKTTRSSANLEEEEFHSENSVIQNAKKNDGFSGINTSALWDLHVKTVSKGSTTPIQCTVTRKEIEHGKDMQYQCSKLDSDLLGVQTVLGFSSREQLVECQRINTFLMNQNFLPGFYTHDNRTEERRPQEPEHLQGSSDVWYAGYPSIRSSTTGNENFQQSESLLRQYQQHNEIQSPLFRIGHKRFENQSKQQMCFSESTCEPGFLGLCAELGDTRLVAPVQTPQSSVRQSNIIENSEVMSPLPTLSNSERSIQNLGSSLDLQVLDGRTLEQHNHFGQSSFLQFQSQSDFPVKHEEILTHDHQPDANRQFLLHQELHQNQPHQHSTQNFFPSSSSSSSSSPILTGWQDTQQISSGRASVFSNSSSQFGLSNGQWNNRNESLQSNWPQMHAISDIFPRAKYEESKLPSSITYWNHLPQSEVNAADLVWQKHGQYFGTHKAFDANPFACTGQDDWMPLQQLSSGQQYISSTNKVLFPGGRSAPWLNLPLGFHTTHQFSNNQQSNVQEQSLSKSNPHLGTSFDYC